MIIQIYATDDKDYILEHHNFYTRPPELSVSMKGINKYVEDLLSKKDCYKIVIKKFEQ